MASAFEQKLASLQQKWSGGTTAPRTLGGGPASTVMPQPGTSADINIKKIELEKARLNAIRRFGSDPLYRGKIPDFALRDLENLAAGKKDSGGGVLGAIGKIAGKGLEGLGYVLNRPLAVVASAGKEITDIGKGQASWEDFFSQAIAKDTSVSKYIPKSGNKWLDGIVGLVGDIALDPLTYVTFGASAFAGRSGRLALAAKAAEADNLAKIPSLLAKVNDGSIARLGEWALTAAEKEGLGIQSGVSWAFRSKGVIGKQGTALGKISEKAAAAVGKPFALGRASTRFVPGVKTLQKATSTASSKAAGLGMYGRVKDTAEDIDYIAKLGAYSGAARANGAGRLMGARHAGNGQKLVEEISAYEASTGRRIQQVIEGTRSAADDAEQALATRVSDFLAVIREDANNVTREMANRRGVDASEIGLIENYVPHTLSKEAKDYIFATLGVKKGRAANVRELLGMSANDFAEGVAPMQTRSLKTGDRFLGVKLESDIGGGIASMDEVNRIAQDKLKFKLFEEDGAQYISNYLTSVTNQSKRVAFVDRLFDYGPDVVRAYGQKVIPDKDLLKLYKDALGLVDSLTNDLLDDFAQTVGQDVDDMLAPRLEVAKAIADSAPDAKILKPNQMEKISATVSNLVDAIAKADSFAKGSATEVRQAYEAMMKPLRSRVRDLTRAIASGDEKNLAALTGLRELYQRVFPEADLIPDDPVKLAEDIIDGVSAMRGSGLDKAVAKVPDDIAKRNAKLAAPREELAQLDAQLKTRQDALDARLGLPEVIANLPGRQAAEAAPAKIEKLQKEIDDIAKKRQETVDRLSKAEQDALGAGQDATTIRKELKKAGRSADVKTANRKNKILQLQAQIDAVSPLDAAKADWDSGIGAIYKDTIDSVLKAAAERPKKGAGAQATAAWIQKTIKTLQAVNAPGVTLNQAEKDVMERVLLTMKNMESELAVLEQTSNYAGEKLTAIVSGEIGNAKFVDDVIKGWHKIETLGVQMPPEVRDLMFQKVGSLKNAKEAIKLKKMYDAYTKFFKVTAMLTPGFIARNAYTASFNNFVAGVTVGETLEGLKFATSMWRNGVDGALAKLPARKRSIYERALQVAYSSGAGQTADDILAPIISAKGNRMLKMPGIKQWSQANESVEVAARFSLALSSLKRGLDPDAALNQVARYHFDYSDLSSLDEFMRQWIPFWTFASRNIGLQIVNQAARPGLYRRYEALRRNFGVSEEDQTIFPQWLEGRQPLQFPGMAPGAVVNPDLPFIDMEEQLRMFSDPMRLLSQANPLVKLPIELAGGRQLYQNIPFKDEKAEVAGPLDWPALLAGLVTGGGGRRPDGSFYTTQRAAYALPNLLPTLGQVQRVLPRIPFTDFRLGGKESYQDRQSSSVASYFGLPYRRVSQQEQMNELIRRQFAIKNYLSNLTRTGQLTPKEGT